MIMGNPPRMLTPELIKEAGAGSVFVNPHGEVFRSALSTEGEVYLRAQVEPSGEPSYRPPLWLDSLFDAHGPRPVAVGLRLVYKVSE